MKWSPETTHQTGQNPKSQTSRKPKTQTIMSDYPKVNFQGDCGESKDSKHPYSAKVESGGMAPFQQATINGGPPSNCIKGNDGATVYGIELVQNAGVYDYKINVDGQGPKGAGSGNFYLAFKDESGDVYYLKLRSSTRENHTVSYNSSKPNIVEIFWCDYSFSAK
jgi:hypothetical protein